MMEKKTSISIYLCLYIYVYIYIYLYIYIYVSISIYIYIYGFYLWGITKDGSKPENMVHPLVDQAIVPSADGHVEGYTPFYTPKMSFKWVIFVIIITIIFYYYYYYCYYNYYYYHIHIYIYMCVCVSQDPTQISPFLGWFSHVTAFLMNMSRHQVHPRRRKSPVLASHQTLDGSWRLVPQRELERETNFECLALGSTSWAAKNTWCLMIFWYL